MPITKNQTWVNQSLDYLQAGLLPFVEREMKVKYSEDWLKEPQVLKVLQRKKYQEEYQLNDLDIDGLLDLISEANLWNSLWNDVFTNYLKNSTRPQQLRTRVFDVKNIFHLLKDVRDRVSHRSANNAFSLEEVEEALSKMLLVLKTIGAKEADNLAELKKQVYSVVLEDKKERTPETKTPITPVNPVKRTIQMTNRSQKIISIIEKRRPLAHKIESVEANLRELTSVLRELELQRNQLVTRVDDPTISGKLTGIDFLTIQLSIATELEALAKLRVRFSRDTLNIGVVGRARQGKSRLLQSLTGLSAAEIPDGSRQHCTGVRSTIRHNPNMQTYGEVWFHSERSFLDEVIAPYYEKLRLGGKPISVAEFASQPLPNLPNDLPGYAEPGAMYEHLARYHDNFDKYGSLLRSPSQRISQEQIREYVAQDTSDGQRIFFNYLAVKEVKIFCSFPNSEVGQIALVDMPGLGDTGMGDEERLMKTLGQDIDAVLFVRMPSAKGDYWADVDVKLYDTARASLTDLPLEFWSFMILNQTNAESKNGDNFNNCQDLVNDIKRKHINIVECITANCANVEEANSKILDRVLDYLANKIEQLDRQYASFCQERLRQLQNMVTIELEKARQAFVKALPSQNEQARFLSLFNPLYSQISVGLVRLLKELRQERDTQEENFFKPQVEAAIQACRENPGLPTLEEIEIRHDVTGSWDTTYVEYLDKIRTQFTRHFGSMDTGLKQAVNYAKSRVSQVLIETGKLGGITDAKDGEFLKAMAEIVPDDQSQLKKAFQNLWNFKMSYEVNFHYRIRRHLDDITPDSKGIELSRKPNAEEILENLEQLHKETVFKCQEALEDLYCEPRQAAFAAVEEFVDQALRAAEVKDEWQIFLYEVRSKVWPNEFEPVGEGSDVRRDWQKLVERAELVNQPQNLQFLH